MHLLKVADGGHNLQLELVVRVRSQEHHAIAFGPVLPPLGTLLLLESVVVDRRRQRRGPDVRA
jgi:hypothetical protein